VLQGKINIWRLSYTSGDKFGRSVFQFLKSLENVCQVCVGDCPSDYFLLDGGKITGPRQMSLDELKTKLICKPNIKPASIDTFEAALELARTNSCARYYVDSEPGTSAWFQHIHINCIPITVAGRCIPKKFMTTGLESVAANVNLSMLSGTVIEKFLDSAKARRLSLLELRLH